MKRKRVIQNTLSALLFCMMAAYGLFQISKSRTFQFFGTLIARVETQEKVIALTFDDAPTAHSDDVLETLKGKNVRSTFYVIGKNVEEIPTEAKRIVDDGHELGNHSYSHQRFLLKPLAFVQKEIEYTNGLIRKTGYTGPITFRPPYGKKLLALPWYLGQHNILSVMCDVEPDTYLPKDLTEQEKTAFLIDYTIKHTKPGSIILLHPFCDACGSARGAIGPIIDQLHDKGYRFVTVSELVSYGTIK